MTKKALHFSWNRPLFSTTVPALEPMYKGKTRKKRKPERAGTRNPFRLIPATRAEAKAGTRKPEPRPVPACSGSGLFPPRQRITEEKKKLEPKLPLKGYKIRFQLSGFLPPGFIGRKISYQIKP